MGKYNEWKETVEREQSLFEPNPEFMDFLETIEQENMEEDEEQQEQVDNDFVEDDTTRPEELQQEIPGVKNPPRRYTARRKWHQVTHREEDQPRRGNSVQNL